MAAARRPAAEGGKGRNRKKTVKAPTKKKAATTKDKGKKAKSAGKRKKSDREEVDKVLEETRQGPLATLVENQAILFDELRDVRVRIEQLEDLILLEINDLAKKLQDFTIDFYSDMADIRKAVGLDKDEERTEPDTV